MVSWTCNTVVLLVEALKKTFAGYKCLVLQCRGNYIVLEYLQNEIGQTNKKNENNLSCSLIWYQIFDTNARYK